MNLPEKYREKIKNLLGKDYADYENSLQKKRVFGLRVNVLKVSPESFQKMAPFPLTSVPWCSEGFYYADTVRPAKHPYYHCGLYYLQEPSAMSPGALLPVVPGDKVLDLCAAPGGKTTQLGARLQGKGVLVANDVSASRVKALVKNIELFGIRNAVVVNETPDRIAKKFPEYFDKILIDAPCSGEGMFRKEPDVAKSWGEKMSAFCQKEQAGLLEQAASMLAPGGLLLYSTCTFAPQEDEGQIHAFLKAHQEFSLISLPFFPGFCKGRPDTVFEGTNELEKCVRLYPHKIKGEGHFLCLLKKEGKPPASVCIESAPPVPEKKLAEYRAFEEQALNCQLTGNFQIFGEDLYLLPDGVPKLDGIRVVRSGWHLGQFKKNRFEPYQAFAMGLCEQDAKLTVNFSSGQEETIRYLKGESFEVSRSGKGYCLVLCDGFPLGFGKLLSGRMKNKYFAGWRLS